MENYFSLNFTIGEIGGISNLGLAYVGDAVFELLVRVWLCKQGNTNSGRMHKAAVSYVSAPAQARFVELLMPILGEEEKAVYRRGRNSHVGAVPQNATVTEYHAATGLEALFGHLYLEGKTERINELFEIITEGGVSDAS